MELTEVEMRVATALAKGWALDLSDANPTYPLTPETVASWGSQQLIRAGALRDILLGRLGDTPPDPRGLCLVGATIEGRLDLNDVVISFPIVLYGCHLIDGFTSTNARLSSLCLDRSVINSENKVGVVRLLGAKIGGQLSLSGVRLVNRTGPALDADRMHVDGGVFLADGFVAEGAGEVGAVRLAGAKIGGQLSLKGARLVNRTGSALVADGVHVDGGVFLADGFVAEGAGEVGAVRLLGAKIGGQLSLDGARLVNRTGPALVADRMQVDSDMFLNEEFIAEGAGEVGAVRLPGARVAGRLGVSTAVVDRAKRGHAWVIDGLTYAGTPSCGTRQWLSLLREGTVKYQAQPYQQLASAARAAGHDREARHVLMAQRKHQASRKGSGDLSLPERLWVKLTGLILGYGYQPWRSLIGLLGVLIIACAVVGTVPDGLAHTKTAGATLSISASAEQRAASAQGSPCSGLERFLVAVDIAVPLIDTGVKDTCAVTPTSEGRRVTTMAAILRLFSWGLTALFVAGFTSAVRKT